MAAVVLIVIEVVMSARGRPSSRVSMSAIEAIGTPRGRPRHWPARRRSRSPSGSAGRRPPRAPSGPARAGSGSRSLVSAAVEKPAYWRIVHRRPRYIVGWTPRVNGNSPGRPRSRASSRPAVSAGVYRSAIAGRSWCGTRPAVPVARPSPWRRPRRQAWRPGSSAVTPAPPARRHARPAGPARPPPLARGRRAGPGSRSPSSSLRRDSSRWPASTDRRRAPHAHDTAGDLGTHDQPRRARGSGVHPAGPVAQLGSGGRPRPSPRSASPPVTTSRRAWPAGPLGGRGWQPLHDGAGQPGLGQGATSSVPPAGRPLNGERGRRCRGSPGALAARPGRSPRPALKGLAAARRRPVADGRGHGRARYGRRTRGGRHLSDPRPPAPRGRPPSWPPRAGRRHPRRGPRTRC